MARRSRNTTGGGGGGGQKGGGGGGGSSASKSHQHHRRRSVESGGESTASHRSTKSRAGEDVGDDEPEYEVEGIIDYKEEKGRVCRPQSRKK